MLDGGEAYKFKCCLAATGPGAQLLTAGLVGVSTATVPTATKRSSEPRLTCNIYMQIASLFNNIAA